MPARFYDRFGPLICLVALALSPLLAYGTVKAFLSHTNDVADWLPETFDETQRLFWFVERFGSDEILVVSWPGCTLEDERLDRFADELLRPHPPDGSDTGVHLFRRVFTGRQVYLELTGEPLRLSPVVALERMRGWLLGPDWRTTCAVALVSRAGMTDRHAALDAVHAAAARVGLEPQQLRIGGSTADSVAIDRAGMHRIYSIAAISAAIGLVIAWGCLRRLHLVMALFLASAFAWGLSLSIVYFTGTNLDAVLLLMPALVFVLGVSGGVHLTHYYRDALLADPADAPVGAVRRGWLPSSLANTTTAIGLASLAISQVRPISRFGIYAAIGVIGVLVCLLVLWPSIVAWWTRGSAERTQRTLPPREHTSEGALLLWCRRMADGWWEPLYRLSTGRHLLLLVLGAAALAAGVIGVTRLKTSARLEDLLPAESDLIQDYAWLQERIGPLVPAEVVLRFPPRPPDDPRELVRRMLLVESLRAQIDELPHAGGSIAATTFTAEVPTGGGARNVAERRLIGRRTLEHLERLVELRYLHIDDREELWRISTRVEALKGHDYGEFLRQLDALVAAQLAEQRQAGGSDVTYLTAGAVPLIYMAQEQLLRDLIHSFALAFVLVSIVMAILVRSLSGGLLSMMPNIFPVVVVFGTLGWLGNYVDIGTTMTASAALGIAIDDTLHFLTWYRRGLRHLPTRREAIRHAFHHAATPIVQTSMICGLGLAAFALSTFIPTARFGWLMALLLVAAPVGDLLLLPALLASPLGRVFGPPAGSEPQPASSQHALLERSS
jgi:uncharacterized protein